MKNINDLSIFVFWVMIFMHTIGDFILQTDFLANYKQKKNWKDYGKEYKFDYIPVLFVHSFMWSFCTFLPLLLLDKNMACWSGVLVINTILHATIDDTKCNKLEINLVVDQLIHLLQILATWLLYINSI